MAFTIEGNGFHLDFLVAKNKAVDSYLGFFGFSNFNN